MTHSIKAELIEIVQSLPDDCTIEDLRANIQRGLDEAQSGNVVPHEQVKRRFAERWAAS